MLMLAAEDERTVAVVQAIREGDLEGLDRLLRADPELATARISDPHGKGQSRSLLHILTDWPGHYPNSAATVAALVAAGADVNARFDGRHAETPLHWAASCDDVAVLDALVEAGADLEADGAVIGGGTPMADAVAFGQWHAARRLLEHGARTNLWQAAALGLLDRVEEECGGPEPPAAEELTKAFWCACHGGQRHTAEYLLGQGADLNWVGYDQLTPLAAAVRSEAHELAGWLREQGAR